MESLALGIGQETHVNAEELGAFRADTEKHERGAALLIALHGSTDRSLEEPLVTDRPDFGGGVRQPVLEPDNSLRDHDELIVEATRLRNVEGW